MRRIVALVSLSLIALLSAPAGPAAADTVVQPLPGLPDVSIDGACGEGFPVMWTDRGGRTLSTTFDDSGEIVRQVISGSSIVEYSNPALGIVVPFDVRGTTTIVYGADGFATVTQKGPSFIATDMGFNTKQPVLLWGSGKAVSTGIYDKRQHTLDVYSKSLTGRYSDICEMLVSGLKTRH